MLLLGLSASAALAQLASPSDCTPERYCALREATSAGQVLSWQDVKADPAGYPGRVFEVQGRVIGTVTSDSSGLCLLKTLSGDTLTFKLPSPSQILRSGNEVRVLLLVSVRQDSPPSAPTYQLVAAIGESDYLFGDTPSSAAAAGQANPAADPNRRHLDLLSRGWAHRNPPGNLYLPQSAPLPVQTAPAGSRAELSWQELVHRYAQAARYFNKRLSDAEALLIADTLLRACAREGLAPQLAVALIACESSFNPRCVSRTGAKGLGQLMPSTAAGMGVTNPFDIRQNLDASIKLIAGHLRKFSDRPPWEQLALGLACYNAGSGAVAKYGGVPPYTETRNYIRKVTRLYLQLTGAL